MSRERIKAILLDFLSECHATQGECPISDVDKCPILERAISKIQALTLNDRRIRIKRK